MKAARRARASKGLDPLTQISPRSIPNPPGGSIRCESKSLLVPTPGLHWFRPPNRLVQPLVAWRLQYNRTVCYSTIVRYLWISHCTNNLCFSPSPNLPLSRAPHRTTTPQWRCSSRAFSMRSSTACAHARADAARCARPLGFRDPRDPRV